MIMTTEVFKNGAKETREVTHLEQPDPKSNKFLPVPKLSEGESYVRTLDNTIVIIEEQIKSEPTDHRPHNCRNRLIEENKPYPKSSCEHCGSVLMKNFQCPHK